MNKKILIIIGTIIVLAIIVILSLSSNNHNSNLNLDDLKRNIFKQYNEINLRVLENEEIRNYFGIDLKDDIDSLFITDYFIEDEPKPFSPNVLIVVVNSKDYHDYATLLKNYIDVEIMNSLEEHEKFFGTPLLGYCFNSGSAAPSEAKEGEEPENGRLLLMNSQAAVFACADIYRTAVFYEDKLGFKAVEIPIYFQERTLGTSKMSLGISFEAAWRTLVLRSQHKDVKRRA